jgi:glucosamine--fructose-6-phosphate aminotransferase (isomerizing)
VENNLPAEPFLKDVLDQPAFFRKALEVYPVSAGEKLFQYLRSGNFNKIILTGHGSSYNSLYPTLLKLNSNGIPSILWQTAELLHYGINQIDSHSLLIVNSQSGQSAEVISLINKISDQHPSIFLSLTNNPTSDLGRNSDIIIPLNAGEEYGVATKTYINALGMSALLSIQLCGENINNVIIEMQSACNAMEKYLAGWQSKVNEIDEIIGEIKNTIIVGRGPSMATAMNAALNQKEAAWRFTEGMNAGEFRHGPLELADPNMTLIIIEGDPITSPMNYSLAEEVKGYGCDVIWIGNHPPAKVSSINIPEVADIARPMAEILPLQLLAHVLANRQNLEAGKFRRIGKVVLKE